MNKIKEEEAKRRLQRFSRFIKAALVLIIIIFIFEIWVVNRLSTSGYKIEELKKAQAILELENQVLASRIAEESSLWKMEEKALFLGFKNIKNFDYLKPLNLASSF